jgi:serine/threonine protein kinase
MSDLEKKDTVPTNVSISNENTSEDMTGDMTEDTYTFSDMHGLKLIDLLNDDLYTTFKANYKGNLAIAKFFHLCKDGSDDNNEYEVLVHLQKYSSPDQKRFFPVPYGCMSFERNVSLFKKDKPILTSIRKVIVYQYMEGTPLNKTTFNPVKMKADINKIITYLHILGFVYADIKLSNILRTPDDEYILIDFGRTFSVYDKACPPMKYMRDEDEIPTQKEDIAALVSL